MKHNLYDVLGVEPDAPKDSVRAAVRRLVRRYHVSTRDLGGDVEEALRFINAASGILLADRARRLYNADLARANANADATGRLQGTVATTVDTQASLHAEAAYSVADSHQTQSRSVSSPGSLEALVEIPRLSVNKIGTNIALVVGAVLFALIVGFLLAEAPDWLSRAKSVMMSLAMMLVAIAVAMFFRRLRMRRPPAASIRGLAELPVIKWRRERSIYIGSRPLQEEQSWVYRLRVCELDRAKNKRTSDVSAATRSAARALDYLLLGVLVTLIAGVLSSLGISFLCPTQWWCLPIIVVALAIPIEALLIQLGWGTPGKWIFGLRVTHGLTLFGGEHTPAALRGLVWNRAWRVGMFGAGLGIPLIGWISGLLAMRKLGPEREPLWDAAGDSEVTQTRLPVIRFAAGVLMMCALATLHWKLAYPSLIASAVSVHTFYEQTRQRIGGQIAGFRLPEISLPELSLPTVAVLDKLRSNGSEKTESASDLKDPAAAQGSAPRANAETLEQKERRWRAWERSARQAMSEGNIAAMQSVCERWSREESRSFLAWKCFGLALAANGQHIQAIEAFRKAQRLDATDRSLDGPIAESFRIKQNVPQ